MNIKGLTKAEEQIMQVLWKIEKGFVKDIIEKLPDPKPAYNTVSTIVRILEKKNIVSHTAYGKTHEYYPLISKKEYSKSTIKSIVKDYFNNSYAKLASFFTNENDLSISELEEIKNLIENEIKNKKA